MSNSRSDKIDNIALALMNFQAEMPVVGMNRVNTFLNNTQYTDLTGIIEAIKPFLKKNGLSFTQLPTEKTENGLFLVGVETILMHTTGEYFSSLMYLPIETKPAEGKKEANISQKSGSVISYIKRYQISSMLGVVTEEDNDGNQNSTGASSKSSSEDKNVLSLRNNIQKLYAKNADKQKTYDKLFSENGKPESLKDLDKLQNLYKKMNEVK